jgi:HAT1-interacting factor 1
MADQGPASGGDAPVAVEAPLSAIPASLQVASAPGTPGPATGTVTPALSAMEPEQAEHSLRVTLAELCAKGAALSTQKNYEEAAEVYSRATEMQAEMNGEMSPENAEILFLYGRALFRVGQGKSDVLGGKAPDTAPKKAKAESSKAAAAAASTAEEEVTPAQRVAEEGVAIIAAETTIGKQEASEAEAKKPFFQFTGDENWDDSDGEDVRADFLRVLVTWKLTLADRLRKKRRPTVRRRMTWLWPLRSLTWRAFSSQNG